MPETFLTVKEVARRLAVGRTTVYELIAKRELMAIRIGREAHPGVRTREVDRAASP
jgi:excisionase family DNA binding protein